MGLILSLFCAENVHVIAVGNFDGIATLSVIQRDPSGSTKVFTISEPSNRSVSEYCAGHGCRNLLVMNHTFPNSTIRYLVFVPLENGIWIIDLRYNGSEISYSAMHTTLYSLNNGTPACQTLDVFNIQGVIYALCIRDAHMLGVCSMQILEDNLTASFPQCTYTSTPRILHISNVVVVGDNIDLIHLRFFIGKLFYGVRVRRKIVMRPSMIQLEECDYIDYMLQGESSSEYILYCDNDRVYSFNQLTGSNSLLGEGGLYYPCSEEHYVLDHNKECLSYRNLSVRLSTSDYDSGICFGEEKFVYNDRVSGAYVVSISQNYDRLEVVSLNTSGCIRSFCDVISVFLDRYILIRNNHSFTVIDSVHDTKIIQIDDVPTSLVTVIPHKSAAPPTSTGPPIEPTSTGSPSVNPTITPPTSPPTTPSTTPVIVGAVFGIIFFIILIVGITTACLIR